ncbi:hypothetical protein [uncultured Tateyamaria sp.]|uniref:hypothetical protein n=1 Tax=uncultured Tateyamaria sp. TaxID=455651 RepID=UPI002614377C|nr:hypothetical protein [uncultured Tateyamaria sp.]
MASVEKDIDAAANLMANDINAAMKVEDLNQFLALKDRLQSKKRPKGGMGPVYDLFESGKADKSKGPGIFDKLKEYPTVRVVVSKSDVANKRTPKKQAELIITKPGQTSSCRSAHMIGAARHVQLTVNGVKKWDTGGLKMLKKDFPVLYERFVIEFGKAFKKQGVNNHKGKPKFEIDGGDPFHIEFEKAETGSKFTQDCLHHYAKLTRMKGKPKNPKFEGWKYVKAFFKKNKKYEKAAAK